ncbi:hypothetical protein FE74_15200, partial [Staphylococcus aureus]
MVKKQDDVLLTHTTIRDAHQSLLSTRVRSKDMINIAYKTTDGFKDGFSLEMWGGAFFDAAYKFLKANPCERFVRLRIAIPIALHQMRLRASNAVGYKNYPDNVFHKFVQARAK